MPGSDIHISPMAQASMTNNHLWLSVFDVQWMWPHSTGWTVRPVSLCAWENIHSIATQSANIKEPDWPGQRDRDSVTASQNFEQRMTITFEHRGTFQTDGFVRRLSSTFEQQQWHFTADSRKRFEFLLLSHRQTHDENLLLANNLCDSTMQNPQWDSQCGQAYSSVVFIYLQLGERF